MKNKHFIAGIAMSYFLLLATSLTVRSQQPNVSLSDQMDYAIAHLDFTEVSSGLLLDRGFKMMHVEDFDGAVTADTLFQYGDWFRQYGTMVTSKVIPSSTLGQTADWKPYADSLLNTGVVPLMILHADYHKFLEDSVLLASLITYQNGQLYDVPNRPTSPYTAHEIFSFCPKKTNVKDSLSQIFRIESEFFRSNTGKTVSSISIDFDNGMGYQSMTYNVNKKVSWTSPGKKYLTLKVVYSDNSTYYAKSLYEIVDKTGAQPKNYYGIPDQEFHIDHPTIANHGATVTIEYGCGNTELRKPFIYVEGFNPDQFGNMNYDDGFLNDFMNYHFIWDEGFPMLDALEENGYDVVYIDFDRGAGDLKENAQTVREVIKELNAQKAANGSASPNVLVGYSMGGVVGRLALTYMENANENHDVSYYISVDSPHLGANVPRGIIAALIDIRNYEFAGFNVSEDVPTVEEAYQVLFSPAAKQMLIYGGEGSNSLITGPSPTYTAFQNHLDAQGMPAQTIQNIAVSKGSGNGVGQGYGSLEKIFKLNANTFNATGCITNIPDIVGWLAGAGALNSLGLFASVKADIKAMPGYVSSTNWIYERKIRMTLLFIPLEWDSHKTKAKTVNFYDGVQGGRYGFASFSGMGADALGYINALANGVYMPCAKLYHTQFCFIPTVSALNIPSMMGTPNWAIDTESIVDNDDTPFDKAYVLDPTKYPSGYTAPNNENHLDLTPSNVFPFEQVISTQFNAVNQNPTVHGYTFNFGYAEVDDEIIKTTDCITHPLTVSGIPAASGALWINRAHNLEDVNNANNPLNTSDTFNVDLKESCNGTYGKVTVESMGSITIGENHLKTAKVNVRKNAWITMNDGYIEVRPGSKLIIEDGAELRLNGGILRVQDGGEVIIKRGGKLIYEDGAIIELNGHDAVLALGGLTHVGNDATFTFTYEGSASGHIRMLDDGYWGERFFVGTNADVVLKGEGQNDLILYLEESVNFWEYQGEVPGYTEESNLFRHVKITDGRIEFEDDSRLQLINPSTFDNVHFQRVGPGNPRGVVPMSKCNISNSTFRDVPIDAQMHFSNGGMLYIKDSKFHSTYVKIRGKGYEISGSHFFSSQISSLECTRKNKFMHSTISAGSHLYGYQCAIEDKSTSELYIYKSTIHNSYAVGVHKQMSRVTAKCSKFINNSVGIVASDNAVINLSFPQGGGSNLFEDNYVNIEVVDAYDILLKDGFNQIYDGTLSNIMGTLDRPYDPPCPYINATNNTWTPADGQAADPNHPDQNEFDVKIEGANPWQWCSVPFHFGVVAPVGPCRIDPEDTRGEQKSNPEISEYPLITTPIYFHNTPFDEAVEMAMAKTTAFNDSLGDDVTAAAMYFELLMAEAYADSDSMQAVVDGLKYNTIFSYKSTVENLFSDGIITAEMNNQTFVPTVEGYADVLMAYTDSIKVTDTYRGQFQLELAKTALFKTIGKPEMALLIVENLALCNHDSIQEIILEKQRANLLFDISSKETGIHAFLYDSITFVLDSSIFDFPVGTFVDSSGFGAYIFGPNNLQFSVCQPHSAKRAGTNNPHQSLSISEPTVYPNPASRKITIQFQGSKAGESSSTPVYFELYDIHGKHCFSGKVEGMIVQIELPPLPSALYHYTISQADRTLHRGKLLIAQ